MILHCVDARSRLVALSFASVFIVVAFCARQSRHSIATHRASPAHRQPTTFTAHQLRVVCMAALEILCVLALLVLKKWVLFDFLFHLFFFFLFFYLLHNISHASNHANHVFVIPRLSVAVAVSERSQATKYSSSHYMAGRPGDGTQRAFVPLGVLRFVGGCCA